MHRIRSAPLVASTFTLVGLAAAPASAQQPIRSVVAVPVASAPALVSHISSTGRGEVRVTPDHAILSIVIETRGDTAASVTQESARRGEAVVQALRAAGVPASAISVPGYTVSSTTGPTIGFAVMEPGMVMGPGSTRNGARTPTTFARRTLHVEPLPLASVDRAVSAALGAGATQVGVQLATNTLARAQQEALEAAVADARSNAEAMARGAGAALGRMVDMSTIFSPSGGLSSYAIAAPYESSPFGSLSVPPTVRDVVVTAGVTVRWESVMPGPTRTP